MKKLFIILLLFCSALTHAQQLKVSADKNPALVGEQILVQYSINTKAENFKSPNFNGLQVLSGPNPSTQSSYSFVNGESQSSISTTYSFYLKAVKEGTYNISPATIIVKGKTIKSKAYQLKVLKEIFLIKDIRINSEDIDCFFLQELCENIQEGTGRSFYTTGEKKIEVSCQNTMDWWDPLKVTYYYKNGNKESEQLYYGCETESGPYTAWWENGNLKYKGDWNGDAYAEEWHENGQVKNYYEIKGDLWDGHCITKEVTYYNNGKFKSYFVCEDCDIWGKWNNCAPKKCFNNIGERIKCTENKK